MYVYMYTYICIHTQRCAISQVTGVCVCVCVYVCMNTCLYLCIRPPL